MDLYTFYLKAIIRFFKILIVFLQSHFQGCHICEVLLKGCCACETFFQRVHVFMKHELGLRVHLLLESEVTRQISQRLAQLKAVCSFVAVAKRETHAAIVDDIIISCFDMCSGHRQ